MTIKRKPPPQISNLDLLQQERQDVENDYNAGRMLKSHRDYVLKQIDNEIKMEKKKCHG